MSVKRKRFVVQIATALGDDGRHVVYALCDDGTMWAQYPNAEDERFRSWRRVSDIPEIERDPVETTK